MNKNTNNNCILVVNSGSMTTRVALFSEGLEICSQELLHPQEVLAKAGGVLEQLPIRRKAVEDFLEKNGVSSLLAVAARGVPLKPMKAGTYLIDEALIGELKALRVATAHVSILSSLIGWEIAVRYGVKSYFTDPISVDEFIPEARMTGRPEIERKSLWHALNCRAVLRRCCEEHGFDVAKTNFIAVHLGSGITIACFEKGRAIDVCNANSESPFSPERSGTLPFQGLVEFCFDSGLSKKELLTLLQKQSGFIALLGTNDLREVERRVAAGDKKAGEVYSAFIYNIAKSIGSYAPVVNGKLDGIIFTGAMAKSSRLISMISDKVSFLGKIFVYPGQYEMEALAYGTWQVATGLKEALRYEV